MLFTNVIRTKRDGGELSDEQIQRALFTPCRDIAATVNQLLDKLGPGTRICAMPEGPQTIAYVRERQ